MAEGKTVNPHLTDEQKAVLFDKGTEAPFSGTLLHQHATGDYTCANCGAVVFTSTGKYDSSTPGLAGWPSFSEAAAHDAVTLQPDNSHGMQRTEVSCARCGSHLGHLFDDPSSPNGQHYCINSIALDFKGK